MGRDERGGRDGCGFEPAKALIQGLLLPRFRDRVGYQLPALRPTARRGMYQGACDLQ